MRGVPGAGDPDPPAILPLPAAVARDDAADVGQPALAQIRQGLDAAGDVARGTGGVGRVEVLRPIVAQVGHRAPPRREYRACTGLRLDDRPAEALGPGRIEQGLGSGVQGRERRGGNGSQPGHPLAHAQRPETR